MRTFLEHIWLVTGCGTKYRKGATFFEGCKNQPGRFASILILDVVYRGQTIFLADSLLCMLMLLHRVLCHLGDSLFRRMRVLKAGLARVLCWSAEAQRWLQITLMSLLVK
ncbi:hypothetical protein CEXT_295981 [Caerostris extrusa]|uniref:Uncharacterized protein n=1 Tax=Caerostris extrusa TaxID=172846 RepID=A0AAV4UUF1_CAEEX|nr:hypothetical protein CEXT_295981 [Caerostris extrusa]